MGKRIANGADRQGTSQLKDLEAGQVLVDGCPQAADVASETGDYGPENYIERCRHYFGTEGGFTTIPGSADADLATLADPDNVTDLPTRIRLAGIKQVELASRLLVTQSFVNQILSGVRPWPDRIIAPAEALLRERELLS